MTRRDAAELLAWSLLLAAFALSFLLIGTEPRA